VYEILSWLILSSGVQNVVFS